MCAFALIDAFLFAAIIRRYVINYKCWTVLPCCEAVACEAWLIHRCGTLILPIGLVSRLWLPLSYFRRQVEIRTF